MDLKRNSARASAPAPATPPPARHESRETGWLPDCVYTGDKFETGLAFFADPLGRITRFSREPAELAGARRLAGQAALPGLVNAHSHAFQRVLRGRTESRSRNPGDPLGAWREAHDRTAARLGPADLYDAARMAFLEMLLAGITCVGEFQYLRSGDAAAGANALDREILRAAHDVGIRIALLKTAWSRSGFRAAAGSAPALFGTGPVDAFLREVEALRTAVAADYPADEAWVGVAAQNLGAVPLDQIKALAQYAHGQRMRLHVHVATTPAEVAACHEEYGRGPVALLGENGLVDKRFTAIDAIHLSDDEVKALGAARASVVLCPLSGYNLGLGPPAAGKLAAAGAGLALGTDGHGQIDLLKEGRMLEYRLRIETQQRPALAPDAAKAIFHAATFAGARSLGATGGALEVGRPADFFTVALFDPSIAGSDPETLLANVIFALERRAIREVWVGARQRVVNGRHAFHGPVVGRFVELQQRLWTASS